MYPSTQTYKHNGDRQSIREKLGTNESKQEGVGYRPLGVEDLQLTDRVRCLHKCIGPVFAGPPIKHHERHSTTTDDSSKRQKGPKNPRWQFFKYALTLCRKPINQRYEAGPSYSIWKHCIVCNMVCGLVPVRRSLTAWKHSWTFPDRVPVFLDWPPSNIVPFMVLTLYCKHRAKLQHSAVS